MATDIRVNICSGNVAWRHQAITWTNVDWSSVTSSDIHIRIISQEMPQPSITNICLKITGLKLHSNFLGASELTFSLKQIMDKPGQITVVGAQSIWVAGPLVTMVSTG